MFVLSYVLPPVDGAAYGKAEVCEAVTEKQQAADVAGNLLILRGVYTLAARRFCNTNLMDADTGTDVKHNATGITFRIDPEDRAPNVCPCCGRLVKWGDHAFAGSDDAYCLGCYTWGDSSKISCDPHHTAHANPWTTDTENARWRMSVVIDHDGETGDDNRYATTDDHQMWDDTENALIAWPGLTRDQIIEVTITEIDKES